MHTSKHPKTSTSIPLTSFHPQLPSLLSTLFDSLDNIKLDKPQIHTIYKKVSQKVDYTLPKLFFKHLIAFLKHIKTVTDIIPFGPWSALAGFRGINCEGSECVAIVAQEVKDIEEL